MRSRRRDEVTARGQDIVKTTRDAAMLRISTTKAEAEASINRLYDQLEADLDALFGRAKADLDAMVEAERQRMKDMSWRQ